MPMDISRRRTNLSTTLIVLLSVAAAFSAPTADSSTNYSEKLVSETPGAVVKCLRNCTEAPPPPPPPSPVLPSPSPPPSPHKKHAPKCPPPPPTSVLPPPSLYTPGTPGGMPRRKRYTISSSSVTNADPSGSLPTTSEAPAAHTPAPSPPAPSLTPSESLPLEVESLTPPTGASSVGRRQTPSSSSRTHWRVTVIDDKNKTVEKHLKSSDVWNLNGEKIVVPFDSYGVPTDDVARLLGQIIGQLAAEPISLPISYDDWRHMPPNWKNEVFDSQIKMFFHFTVADVIAQKWTLKNLGKKWNDFKWRLWCDVNDTSLTLEQMYDKLPSGVPKEQWKVFVDRHRDEKRMDLSRQNASNRVKQVIPHTAGSKSFSRSRMSLLQNLGHEASRTELWLDVHRKSDDSFVNEPTKEVKIKELWDASPGQSYSVSQDDPVAQVLGKEHPGRVRGMGLGPVLSKVFSRPSGIPAASTPGYGQPIPEDAQREISSLRATVQDQGAQISTMQKALTDLYQQMSRYAPSGSAPSGGEQVAAGDGGGEGDDASSDHE